MKKNANTKKTQDDDALPPAKLTKIMIIDAH